MRMMNLLDLSLKIAKIPVNKSLTSVTIAWDKAFLASCPQLDQSKNMTNDKLFFLWSEPSR